jgi:hypothetical protein
MRIIDGITQNQTTQKISLIIALAMAIGIILLVSGPKIGIIGAIFIALAIIAIQVGWTKFEPSVEIGALKVADQFVKNKDGKTVWVDGMTMLAPYPPFYVDVVRVNVELFDLIFQITIMTVEEDPGATGKVKKSFAVNGTLIITTVADSDHLDKFERAGGWTKIQKDMGNLPYQVVQHIVTKKKLSAMDLVMAGEKITKLLERHVLRGTVTPGSPDKNGQLRGEFFGFKPLLVRIDFKLSEDMLTSMSEVAQAEYKNAVLLKEAEGDLKRLDLIQERTKTPEGKEAWERMLDADLLAKGGLSKIKIEGNGAVILNNAAFHGATGSVGKK